MDLFHIFLLVCFIIAIIIIKKFALIFLIPLIRVYFTPEGLSGPGGHKYITDMKKQLSPFDLRDLACTVDVEYDKSVNFKVAGVVKDYRDEKKCCISFYGDLVFPKDTVVRKNKLLGPISAITFNDKMEIEADNNLFKLRYMDRHIASLHSNMKIILDPTGKETGLIESPEIEPGNAPAIITPEYKSIKVNGGEIAKTMGLHFSSPENKEKFAGIPLFKDIKPELSDFERELLHLIVISDIYSNSIYYFQNK